VPSSLVHRIEVSLEVSPGVPFDNSDGVLATTFETGPTAVLDDKPVDMTLDPQAAGDARAVTITLQPADGATRPARWQVRREGDTVAAGSVRPGQTREVRLPVPPCDSNGDCEPVTWTLRASGPPVWLPFPAFGPPGGVRPVLLNMTAARIE